MEFNSSLLREKFSLHDPAAELHESGGSVIALSNRLVVDLQSESRKYKERFVVRAQNMHACVRMSARIIQSFEQGGPIMNRGTAFDWEAAWDSLVNDYEHAFNKQRWVAVYHKGRVVFESGEHHTLLDVIEQCDTRNEDSYDDSVALAEEAFKTAGKVVTINHDSNVALVVDFEGGQGRCGIILRGPDRTTTFNFSAESKNNPLSIPQCLGAAAAFLEGVQLAFMVGMNNERASLGIIEQFSQEEKQTREAKKRLTRLSAEIANLESAYEIHYRPERPEFPHLVLDAERLAKKILKPPEGSTDFLKEEDTEKDS